MFNKVRHDFLIVLFFIGRIQIDKIKLHALFCQQGKCLAVIHGKKSCLFLTAKQGNVLSDNFCCRMALIHQDCLVHASGNCLQTDGTAACV